MKHSRSVVARPPARLPARQASHIGIFLLLLFTLLSLSTRFVEASDAFFTCNETSCTPGTIDSFFPADKWYPGMNVAKTFSIHNTSGEKRTVGLSAFNESVSSNLDNIITLSVKETGASSNSWNGTVRELFNNDEVILPEILAGEIKEFELKFVMDENADNTYQDKTMSFDLNIGLLQPTAAPTGEPGPTETPTPPAGGTGEATSRFTITNLLNRSRIVVTVPPPVLGVEEARISREWLRLPPNPWLSSLFRGVSCRLNGWAALLLFIQPIFSLLILKYSRRSYLNWSVLSLLGVALISDQISVAFTCFSLLTLFWLNLFWLAVSFYFLRLKLRRVSA